MKVIFATSEQRRILEQLAKCARPQITSKLKEHENRLEKMREHDASIRALPWYKSIFQTEYSHFQYWEDSINIRRYNDHLRLCQSVIDNLENDLTIVMDHEDIEMLKSYSWKDQ